jgi:hypothetical protein
MTSSIVSSAQISMPRWQPTTGEDYRHQRDPLPEGSAALLFFCHDLIISMGEGIKGNPAVVLLNGLPN